MILIDTREQKYNHITEWFDAHGVKYDRSKLYVGDYIRGNSGRISIDRKHNMAEVYGNVISQHDRFRREMVNAQEAGVKLIILIEDPRMQYLEDVADWKNPRMYAWLKDQKKPKEERKIPKPADSVTVMKIMQRMAERYECEWMFCRKEDTARFIAEILGEGIDDE